MYTFFVIHDIYFKLQMEGNQFNTDQTTTALQTNIYYIWYLAALLTEVSHWGALFCSIGVGEWTFPGLNNEDWAIA